MMSAKAVIAAITAEMPLRYLSGLLETENTGTPQGWGDSTERLLMHTTTTLDTTKIASLTARLRSIEGQARGIQKMLEGERSCEEVIDQCVALRAASHALTIELLEAFVTQCLHDHPDAQDDLLTKMFTIIGRISRS